MDPGDAGKLEPIKIEPKYGYFPWWPEDGDGWVHPEDAAVARRMIPSERVFRKEGAAGAYGVLHYGDVRIRVKPAMWQETPAPAFELGAPVEVLSRGMHNEPRTGVVREILWNAADEGHRYQIADVGQAIPNLYAAEDLRPVEPPSPREQVVVEPPAEELEL